MDTSKRIKRIPWGVTFLNPSDTRVRAGLIKQVSAIITNAGFQRVVPSHVDYLDTFLRASRQNFRPHIVPMRTSYGEELALRPDLTIQVVKGVANQMGKVEFPARLYYTEPVFRNDQAGHASQREIFQIGVEVIGSDDEEATKIELVELALVILKDLLGERHFSLSLGHAGFFDRFCELTGLADERKLEFSRLIDMKALPDIDAFLENSGLGDYREPWRNTIMSFGDRMGLYAAGEFWKEKFNDDLLSQHIDTYNRILQAMDKKGHRNLLTSDLAMVRDFSYYTGLVFEAWCERSGEKLLSGGAYNNLFGLYADRDLNAAGFALNLDAVQNIREMNH